MTQDFTIDNLIHSFTRIYQQFDPANVSVIENEMRKMVPSENSKVYMAGGGNYTDNKIGINLTVTKVLPEEQTKDMDFVSILNACMMKADVEKLAIIYRCVSFLENSWGETYFIDAIPAEYDEEDKESYMYLVIFKEHKKS